MEPPEALEPLVAPIQAVQGLIEEFGNRGIIIGGVAASLLGQPRLTADADAMLLLSLEELPRLLEAAQTMGLQPRFADVIEFARRNRVVLLRHEPSGIDGRGEPAGPRVRGISSSRSDGSAGSVVCDHVRQ